MNPDHESMTIVISMNSTRRFYYNCKTNCLPVEGHLTWGNDRIEFKPTDTLGNLDWGRGIWDYRSFWVWASASGFLPDGRIHKLGQIEFHYSSQNFKQPWRMSSPDGCLDLEFTPFVERVAKTNLLLIASEAHQMFGRYTCTAQNRLRCSAGVEALSSPATARRSGLMGSSAGRKNITRAGDHVGQWALKTRRDISPVGSSVDQFSSQ